MRQIVKILLLQFCFVQRCTTSISSSELDDLWNIYKTQYNKIYTSSANEAQCRSIWEDNFLNISIYFVKWDLGLQSFPVGINEYTDYSLAPYPNNLLGYFTTTYPILLQLAQLDAATLGSIDTTFYVPPSFNWTANGVVTPVKDQGLCGSSWAFVAAGMMEAVNKFFTGTLASISARYILDCVSTGEVSSCYGGYTPYPLYYVFGLLNGVYSEASIPYSANQPIDCNIYTTPDYFTSSANYGAGFIAADENILKYAVARFGPVAAAIDANHWSFLVYASGVYYEPNCDGSNPNHAVLIVGYGTCNGEDYWLIKNSWGTSWGQRGYMMLARNRNNNCGIASYTYYAYYKYT